MNNTVRQWLLLPLLAMVGALLLSALDLGTRARVARNEQIATNKTLLDTLRLPGEAHATLEQDGISADAARLGLRAPQRIYLARVDGRIAALIVPVTARDGFGGDIEMLVGVKADGSVAGVRVLRHRESEQFGAIIERERSDWIEQFVGKSLEHIPPERWSPKSEGGAFDQITGATITSRAVIKAVQQALLYVADHRAQLLPEEHAFD